MGRKRAVAMITRTVGTRGGLLWLGETGIERKEQGKGPTRMFHRRGGRRRREARGWRGVEAFRGGEHGKTGWGKAGACCLGIEGSGGVA